MTENIHLNERKEKDSLRIQGRIEVIDYQQVTLFKSLVQIVLFDGKDSLFVRLEEDGPVSYAEVSHLQEDDEIDVEGILVKEDGEFYLKATKLLSVSPLSYEKEKHSEHRIEFNLHTNQSQTPCFSSFCDYAKKAKAQGMEAIAITDVGSTQSYPDACRMGKELSLKIIYGLETEFIDEERGIIVPIVVYAKNSKGLDYIYQLVTMEKTHIAIGSNSSIINRSLLTRMKDGLFLAFSPSNIDWTTYLSNDLDDQKFLSRVDFYDFVELGPLSNYLQFVRPSLVNEFIEPQEKYAHVVSLLSKNKKPLIFVSDAHYISLKQKEYATVYNFGSDPTDYRFLSTDDAYQKLDFIKDKSIVDDMILHTPKMFADQIQALTPLDEEYHGIKDLDAMNEIEEIALSSSQTLYGSPLPKEIQERLDKELDWIEKNHLAPLVNLARKLRIPAEKDNEYPILNGPLSSSFVLYLLSLSLANPLDAHHFCKDCQNFLPEEKSVDYALDLPSLDCTICSNPCQKDGFQTYPSLLFASSLTHLDIEVSIQKDEDTMNELEHLAKEKKVRSYKSSHILSLSQEEAKERVLQYFADQKLPVPSQAEIVRICHGLSQVHDEDDECYSDVLLIPQSVDFARLTPLEYTPVTHFPWMMPHMDGQAFKKNFACFSIHSSQYLYDLRLLNEKTGMDPLTLDEHVKKDMDKLLSLLFDQKALGLADSGNGLWGLPYLTQREFLPLSSLSFEPSFSTLVSLIGLSLRSPKEISLVVPEIIKDPTLLSSLPLTYEDAYSLLLKAGMEEKDILDFLSSHRQGRLPSLDGFLQYEPILSKLNLPVLSKNLLLRSANLIDRGEAVQKALIVLGFAYYKIHRPGLFYACYLEQYTQCYDASSLLKGREETASALAYYQKHETEITYHPFSLISSLKVALESEKRGFSYREENALVDHFQVDEENQTITLSQQVDSLDIRRYYEKKDKEDKDHA